MSLPDIDFGKIRVFNDSRNLAFEELCTQLASLEAAPECEFYRKGRGADGGVECYKIMQDGSEIGWQAKYLFKWDVSLASQLDESIDAALKKHLRLRKYIVCLPFDLPDSRRNKTKSALEKWREWKERWILSAKKMGRDITIDLWDKSQLIIRLSQDSYVYSGRILYWFDRELMSSDWFVTKFERAKASLGERYSPDTNIELPIRQNAFSLTRDPRLQKQIDTWLSSIIEKGRSAVDAILQLTPVELAVDHADNISKYLKNLNLIIGKRSIAANEDYPLDDWILAINEAISLIRNSLEWVFKIESDEQKSIINNNPQRWAEHCIYQLIGFLKNIIDEINSSRWTLVNSKSLLVTGPAGIGKSHLLADIVEYQIYQGYPSILLLGSIFVDGDPWRQILQHLDRPVGEQVKHFLGALDAAAQAKQVKALICIDALNERNGMDVWPSHLTSFLKDVEVFPNISVILSCRSTYVPYVIPDTLGDDQLFRIEHEGFAADGGRASKIYLDKRGITRLGAPNLIPEFNNPLFLKTFCDFLEREGKRELPRSLSGISSIFEYYSKSIVDTLNKRMRLSPYFEIVERAIEGFARLIFTAGKGYLSKRESIDFFESIHNSNASFEKSLLSQLESEGFLTIEPIKGDDNCTVEMVRFTFERFSDYAIAHELLKNNLDTESVSLSFQKNSPLYKLIFDRQNYRNAGIIEAIAVLLPEKTNVEILDIGYEEYPWIIRSAFLESLLWREQSHFTEKTFRIAKQLLDENEINDLLISISTEPMNRFNSLYLHSKFISMSMPERDALWSIYLAERGYEGPTEILISWALNNGGSVIDETRAYLAAAMLTWFLSTSNRSVRDKATKALACILASRLHIAAKLLKNFATINDPYILERLLAACYGATLQGNEVGLKELAKTVYDLIFKKSPPIDILLRDHAQHIIKYAEWKGILDASIKLEKTKPPFKSPWPIEFVPDDLIESYVEDRGRGKFHDDIVGSTVYDGDFARYKIDYKVDDWSPSLYGTARLPTDCDVFTAWEAKFLADANTEALEIYVNYLEVASKITEVPTYVENAKTKRLNLIESQLKAIMSKNQWEAFRVEAKSYIRFQKFNKRRRISIATFNTAWARRWVCKRAHDLGWSSEKFGNFDRQHGSHDRNDHEIERIGKKYQWIAFRELLARMADNLAYITRSPDPEASICSNARQIGMTDIDPSLLTLETHYDGWKEWERTWWSPADVCLTPMEARERLAWLESDKDILNDQLLFDLENPKTNQRWLALSGFSRWTAYGIDKLEKEYQRETWFRVNCFVVHRRDEKSVIRYMKKKIFTNNDNLPKIDLYGEFYLGEYAWHPDLNEYDDWVSPNNYRISFPAPVRATVASYTCERAGYDYSINDTVSFNIPAPWLAKAMNLKMKSGMNPIYVDNAEKVIFYDPSISEPGHSVALVDYDSFISMIKRENLAAIWVIAGEKSVYGGRNPGSGFGGRFLHTAIYHLTDTGFKRYFSSDLNSPSEDQLAEFLGEGIED